MANINSGSGMGAAKGNLLMKALRDDYYDRKFTDENGKIVAKACGVYETALLIKYGYQPNHIFQQISDGTVIFPRDVLCPISWIGLPDQFTENTCSIHKFDDLLIDGKGGEMAAIQRREIEALLRRSGYKKKEKNHGEI